MKIRQTNTIKYIFFGLLPLLFLGQLLVAPKECETGICPPFISLHHHEGEAALYVFTVKGKEEEPAANVKTAASGNQGNLFQQKMKLIHFPFLM